VCSAAGEPQDAPARGGGAGREAERKVGKAGHRAVRRFIETALNLPSLQYERRREAGRKEGEKGEGRRIERKGRDKEKGGSGQWEEEKRHVEDGETLVHR